MYLTDVILRVRETCPMFKNRVGGTAAFSDVTRDRQANLAVPSCFVVPIGEETIEERKDNQNYIYLREQFSTIVCVDNSKKRTSGRGLSASDTVNQARGELLQSLLPWAVADWQTEDGKPELKIHESLQGMEADLFAEMVSDLIPHGHGTKITFVSGSHLNMTDARLWHQFVWETKYYLGIAETDDEKVSLLSNVNNFQKIMYSKYPEIGEVDVSFEPFYEDVLDNETGFNDGSNITGSG